MQTNLTDRETELNYTETELNVTINHNRSDLRFKARKSGVRKVMTEVSADFTLTTK